MSDDFPGFKILFALLGVFLLYAGFFFLGLFILGKYWFFGLLAAYYLLKLSKNFLGDQPITTQGYYPGLPVVKILYKRRAVRVYVGASIILTVFFLGVGSGVYEGIHVIGDGIAIVLAALLLGMAGEIMGLEYRIRKVYFGKNEREAREIIRFIMTNRVDIDFTDDGKPKKIKSEDMSDDMSHDVLEEFVKTVKGKAPNI